MDVIGTVLLPMHDEDALGGIGASRSDGGRLAGMSCGIASQPRKRRYGSSALRGPAAWSGHGAARETRLGGHDPTYVGTHHVPRILGLAATLP